MAFGKRGRPPENRLARQREIYLAVAPLIMQAGARQLSMRQAARVAHLSIGGLYHYFPTKRELVLHGLCPEALFGYCEEFHAQFGHLAATEPRQYLNHGIDVVVQQITFCRPAVHAALELGSATFWDVIDTLLSGTRRQFEENLQRIAPEASEEVLQQWGRAIRRSICAVLLDKNGTPDEFRNELRILVDGYAASVVRHEPVQRHGM